MVTNFFIFFFASIEQACTCTGGTGGVLASPNTLVVIEHGIFASAWWLSGVWLLVHP
jgi:hypothetical protein